MDCSMGLKVSDRNPNCMGLPLQGVQSPCASVSTFWPFAPFPRLSAFQQRVPVEVYTLPTRKQYVFYPSLSQTTTASLAAIVDQLELLDLVGLEVVVLVPE